MRTDAETRARLLATAQRLFGERGFKAVTVRDICTAAKANVAAVNYHFGDKLGLYREVLQVAVDAMRETTEKIIRKVRSYEIAPKPVFLSSRLLKACTA